MRAALALVVVAILLAVGAAEARDRCRLSRFSRTLECGPSLAFFEFAPTSGAGMPSACSTTAPTGAKGETLTFTRTGNATCSKKGLATTGIADGDLVVMSGNVARVEPDADGVLGLRVEGSRANVLVRSDDLSNAAYADVGTPVLTGSQTDPFATTTATTVEDNDGAAYEGRSQSVTVSAGAAYILSCYLKAGTLTTARLSLDGTACNVSGLSSSTWTRATCADASSSGVSIAVQLLVGNATSDTGTVVYGGCQVEAGAYATSYIPTTSAAATRNAETAVATAAAGAMASGSIATSVHIPTSSLGSNRGWVSAATSAPAWRHGLVGFSASTLAALYVNASSASLNRSVAAGQRRLYGYWGSAGVGVGVDSDTTTAAGVTGTGDIQRVCIGAYDCATSTLQDGIYSRICLDPDPTRCR